MSDDVMERGCQEYANELAELALGVLTGRERARVLAHVESCQGCADELELLSRVADTVVQAAPEMEPPLGFEVRLFEKMGVTDGPPRRRLRPSRWVPAVVGVAAAALALGLGLSLTSSSTPTVTAQAHGPQKVTTAALVENGETVGHVVTSDGLTHRVGTFVARGGYGAWIAPLHVDPADVRSAEVVSPSGTVIATATLG